MDASFLSQIASLRAEFGLKGGNESRAGALFAAARRTAAVRGWFDPAFLWDTLRGHPASADKPAWLNLLARICIVDQADPGRWYMLDSVRRDVLSAMSRDGSLGNAVAAAADEPHAQLMGRILKGDFDLRAAPAGELSIAADIARWLDLMPGASAPDPAVLARMMELKLREDELDRLSRGFVGRAEELSDLRRFVYETWANPPKALPIFRLEGIGGVGKSTLLAEFVRRRLPTARFHDPIVISIDYDRLRISANDITSVLIELLRQVGWAADRGSEHLAEARAELRATMIDADWVPARTSFAISEASEDDGVGSSDTRLRALTDICIQSLWSCGPWEDRGVLVVLDTMEQLDRTENRGYDLVVALSHLRQRLMPLLTVVAAGRSILSSGVGEDAILMRQARLVGLTRSEAIGMLTGREKMAQDDAIRLINAFAEMSDDAFRERIGLPMLLALLARLIRDGRLNARGDDLDKVRVAATAELATAYVYSRVLEHVPPDLARLAHPGLVLREVSEELLEQVVWPVVAPGEPLSAAERELLFKRLTDETWLVIPVAGAAPVRVAHRPDLRRAMLSLMYAESEPKTRKQLITLNQRARDWHRACFTNADRQDERDRHLAESVYHALSLAVFSGSAAGIRIGELRAVRPRLRDLVADFPEEHHSAVVALIMGDADPSTVVRLPVALRAPVVRERLRGFLSCRAYGDAIAFCAALPVDELKRSSSIAWLTIRAFVASGQWSRSAAVVAPLLTGPNPAGLQFGLARPSLLAYLAAHAVGGAEALANISAPDFVSIPTNRRYRAFAALFSCFGGADAERRSMVCVEIQLTLPKDQAARSGGDRRRLGMILGAMLTSMQEPMFHVTPSAALLSCAVQGLGNDRAALLALSAAQLVQRCREADARGSDLAIADIAKTAHFAPVLEDFHTPLALALAASANAEQIYRIATVMWTIWPVRPSDFRPTAFMDACARPAIRRERFRTMVALADRSRVTGALLDIVTQVLPDDPDVASVVAVFRQWRTAVGANN